MQRTCSMGMGANEQLGASRHARLAADEASTPRRLRSGQRPHGCFSVTSLTEGSLQTLPGHTSSTRGLR